MSHSNIEYIADLSLFRPEVRHFLIVAEKKNISKASEALGLSQPQLSKSIAAFEQSLGETLFIRKSRGVELTAQGQMLLNKIQGLTKSLSVEEQKENSFRRLRIGFHHSIAMKAYPSIIHPLHAENSPWQLETEFGTSLEITRKVADLQIDFGFVINPQKNPDVVARKIESDFVAIWFKGRLPEKGILYFHPDMLNVQRLLKKMSSFQRIPISDYEVIGQVLATQKNALGILPQSVAERYKLESLQEGRLFSVDVMLIAHRERLKSAAVKNMFQRIQTLYTA